MNVKPHKILAFVTFNQENIYEKFNNMYSIVYHNVWYSML